MILVVTYTKQQELVAQEAIWYEQRWDRGTVRENDKVKLVWDFEFHLRKATNARRPDLILELKTERTSGSVTWHARNKTTLGQREQRN